MDWLSHTFLTGIAGIHDPSEVHAALGFSWGFSIRDGQVEITGLSQLEPAAWDAHLPYLRSTYPRWAFTPGFVLGRLAT